MMNSHIIKIRAYRALIRFHGRYLSKEIRQSGFRVNPDLTYGDVFTQLQGFCMDRFESSIDA